MFVNKRVAAQLGGITAQLGRDLNFGDSHVARAAMYVACLLYA